MIRLRLLALMVAVAAPAPGAVGLEPLVDRPHAVPGGVLRVPVRATGPINASDALALEAGIELVLADGRPLEATIATVWPEPPSGPVGWTDDRLGLSIRPGVLRSVLDRPTARLWVLAELPEDAAGTITLAGRRLEPIWHPPASPPLHGASGPLAVAGPASPDPGSPWAWWRAILVAEADGRPWPPVPGRSQAERLLARHLALLWRSGLERLDQTDPATAERCRSLLTLSIDGPDGPIAAWLADPESIDTLLRRLLDRDRPDGLVADEVAAWLETRPKLLAWATRSYGESVELSLLSRSDRPLTVDLAWSGSAMPPRTVVVPPRSLRSVPVLRPERSSPGPAGSAAAAVGEPARPLEIRVDSTRRTIALPPRHLVAAPPGLVLPALQPPLTLAAAERGADLPVAADRGTRAELRRRHRRWELLIVCRRPDAIPNPPIGDPPPDARDLRGEEAIVLLLGDALGPGGASVVLTIPEQDWWRLDRGPNDDTLRIHRRSLPDRWIVRVVLPDAWLPEPGLAKPLRLGMLRVHGGDVGVESLPERRPPWSPDPGRVEIDLDRWLDEPAAGR